MRTLDLFRDLLNVTSSDTPSLTAVYISNLTPLHLSLQFLRTAPGITSSPRARRRKGRGQSDIWRGGGVTVTQNALADFDISPIGQKSHFIPPG